jgi:rhodanese-related sulfurtransferase
MTTALIILAVMLSVVIGWHVMEALWDRRLFASSPGRVVENLHPRGAEALLAASAGMQIVDVRPAPEFAAGSISGALNMPLGDPAFREHLGKLDLRKPVLIYCAGGYRSRKAIPVLRELGFVSIHHLHRGFMSWKQAGLPVVQTGAVSSSGRR